MFLLCRLSETKRFQHTNASYLGQKDWECCLVSSKENKNLKSFYPKVPEDSMFATYLGKTIDTRAVSQHTSYKSPPTPVQGHPKNSNTGRLGSQPKPYRAVDHGSHTKAVTYEVCGVSAFLLKAVLRQIRENVKKPVSPSLCPWKKMLMHRGREQLPQRGSCAGEWLQPSDVRPGKVTGSGSRSFRGKKSAFELPVIHSLAWLPPRSLWASFNSPVLTFTLTSCKLRRHFSLA